MDSRTYEWTKVGTLNKGRFAHNAIELQGQFLVVGGTGETEFETEKCTYTYGQVDCTKTGPNLRGFAYWPELYLVPDDYCQTEDYWLD